MANRIVSPSRLPEPHLVGSMPAQATTIDRRPLVFVQPSPTPLAPVPLLDPHKLDKCVSQPTLLNPSLASRVGNLGSKTPEPSHRLIRPYGVSSVELPPAASLAASLRTGSGPFQLQSSNVHRINASGTVTQLHRYSYPVAVKSPTAQKYDEPALMDHAKCPQDFGFLEQQMLLERNYGSLAKRVKSQEIILSSVASSVNNLTSKFEDFKKLCSTSAFAKDDQSVLHPPHTEGDVQCQPQASTGQAQGIWKGVLNLIKKVASPLGVTTTI